jgi:predicted nucleotidyltransferase
MLSLREHFLTLLTRIEPRADRAALAIDLPSKVRDFLEDTEKITTIYPHTRLSGSYIRDTAIKQIKDVDILVFVAPEYKDEEDSAQIVINKLVNALNGLPEALGDSNGKVDAELALKRQRRSVLVHVTIDEEEFDMDIVPAILDEDTSNPLEVPDRELSKWISSDPLGYKKTLSKLNQEQNGKIIPLIKMFKHWRDIQMKYQRPKSYWLECMVYQHAKTNILITS